MRKYKIIIILTFVLFFSLLFLFIKSSNNNDYVDTISYKGKTYIYLGQRFKYKGSDYIFTKQEIAKHIGLGDSLNYSGTYKKVNNYLYVLESFGLIKLAYFYEDKTPLIRLVDFKNEPIE